MSVATKPLIEGHTQIIPPTYQRASGDLRQMVKERKAQIAALEDQIPSYTRDGNAESLRQIADLVAVHRETVYQLEAGIAAGQARFDAAKAPAPVQQGKR